MSDPKTRGPDNKTISPGIAPGATQKLIIEKTGQGEVFDGAGHLYQSKKAFPTSDGTVYKTITFPEWPKRNSLTISEGGRADLQITIKTTRDDVTLRWEVGQTFIQIVYTSAPPPADPAVKYTLTSSTTLAPQAGNVAKLIDLQSFLDKLTSEFFPHESESVAQFSDEIKKSTVEFQAAMPNLMPAMPWTLDQLDHFTLYVTFIGVLGRGAVWGLGGVAALGIGALGGAPVGGALYLLGFLVGFDTSMMSDIVTGMEDGSLSPGGPDLQQKNFVLGVNAPTGHTH